MRGFLRFLLRLALALGLIFAFSLWCWLRGQLLGPRQEGAAHKKSAAPAGSAMVFAVLWETPDQSSGFSCAGASSAETSSASASTGFSS